VYTAKGKINGKGYEKELGGRDGLLGKGHLKRYTIPSKIFWWGPKGAPGGKTGSLIRN